MSEKYTGKLRFRRGWRGTLVLQCQVQRHYVLSDGYPSDYNEWRDANIEDVIPLLQFMPGGFQ